MAAFHHLIAARAVGPRANIGRRRRASSWVPVMDHPLAILALSFLGMWLAAWLGGAHLGKLLKLQELVREDFGLILAAALTLLGLIIGFSFSMATSRYDQRKNLEEAEANAIGTEYLRAELLPAAQAAKVRAQLKAYADERVLFYVSREPSQVEEINARTAKLQAELWSSVRAAAAARTDPVMALVVSGMNDVLNSQGYTQAAWWNRIPFAAWLLMAAIAVCCNVLVGYRARDVREEAVVLPVLPLVVSVSFFLIADIDSPRVGLIHVYPQNLASLVAALK
jgi:hypothetical protein